MTTLKDLFDREIRDSMIFLCIGLSIAVCAILGWFQFEALRNDLSLTEQFVLETTKNALVNDQPILVHRSATEFWRAFAGTQTLLKGMEIYIGDALVSQVGTAQSLGSPLYLQFTRCFSTGQNQTCLRYWASPLQFVLQVIYVLFASFVSSLLIYFLRLKIAARNITNLTHPLEREVGRISELSSVFKKAHDSESSNFVAESSNHQNSIEILEIVKLSDSYNELFQHSKSFLELQKETEVSKSLSLMAAQVAHDIRSPLSALNMILFQLPQLKEEQRILIRNSVQRINDIANGLLESSKQRAKQAGAKKSDLLIKQQEVVFLNALIDSIVSEKRIQFSHKDNLVLLPEIDMQESYFAVVNSTELKSVLSNLVNNAVEALEEKGRVTVSLRKGKGSILISVTDNGKGMPETILKKLMSGAKGVSFGKDGTSSGSGLGVHHAKSTIESFGGTFDINSREGLGTAVTLNLPRIQVPSWFIETLNLEPNQIVVALDDDQSIHDIWLGRFGNSEIIEKGIHLLNFKSGNDFKDFVLSKVIEDSKSPGCLFLIDFELAGQAATGLELIEEYGLANNAILVTSRHEEQELQKRCERLGVKILPKLMAGFVPIVVNFEGKEEKLELKDNGDQIKQPIKVSLGNVEAPDVRIRYDLCLLDDDRDLIQVVWATVAASKGLKIKMFSSPQEFLASVNTIDRQTPIYVDVSLGQGVNGVEFANEIYKLGFTEINLATGYDIGSIQAPAFIHRVVGKDFPAIESLSSPAKK